MPNIEQLKGRLEAERERLQRELIWEQTEFVDREHAAVQDTSPGVADDEVAEYATDTYTKELDAALLRRTAMRLDSVKAALERMQVGQYGACVHCGKTIAEGRLEALPWVPFCMDCAQELEVLD